MALGSIFSLPDSVFLSCAGGFGAVTWQVWDAMEPLTATNRAQDRQEGRKTPTGKPSADRAGSLRKFYLDAPGDTLPTSRVCGSG